ncbi:MAG: class I SAM-dependent methyltransferase [Nitrospirae bacterium]|nr:class I SAM-dependent methyltransferase [Nitrospirota bacterium]
MDDAEGAHPVCGDDYAKVFMDDAAMRIYGPFRGDTRTNAVSVARHRIIDDFLRTELAEDRNTRVLIIGSGFDSRPYRLEGGIWLEFDEPQVIAYKNERLPVSDCRNELQRIAVDFSMDSLEKKLSDIPPGRNTIIVIEGVLMYLDHTSINKLLQTLRRIFPCHTLVCDLVTRKFFEKYSRKLHEKLRNLGAVFQYAVDSPPEIFLDNGYILKDTESVVGKAVEYGSMHIPEPVLRVFLRTLANGYNIYLFESKQML